jgi:hypothetical protein
MYKHFEVGKDPQVCQFFNMLLDKDICPELEGHLFKLILSPSDGAAVSEILSNDYCAPGNEKGIMILLGGNHGDQYFRFHGKIHLTSLMERKKRHNISYECPMVQIACYKCPKDKMPFVLVQRFDGGAGCNPIYASVIVVLIHTFLQLNLDALVSIVTAADTSYINEVEGVMPVAKLALQNQSFEQKQMSIINKRLFKHANLVAQF